MAIVTVALLAAGCAQERTVESSPSTATPAATTGSLPEATAAPSTTPVQAASADPSAPLQLGIPGVVRVDAVADAFRAGAPVGVATQPMPAGEPGLGDYVVAAGSPVTVTYPAGALLKPITLTFDVTPPPSATWQPVSMHRADDGTWEPIPGTYDGHGHLTVVTDSFSIQVPSWLDPSKWFNGLVSAATSFFGGRTTPDRCPPAGKPVAPSWLTVTGPITGATHVCSFDNTDAKGQRVEVQLRSNRGVYLVVTNPSNADYVYLGTRSALMTITGHLHHLIADQESILAPGDLMTVGVRRAATPVAATIDVHTNNTMVMVSGVAALFGDVAGPFAFLQCVVNPGSLRFVLTSFQELVSCAVGTLADLRDGDKALAAVRSVSGNSLDSATLGEQAKALVAQADKFKSWGRLFALVDLAKAIFPIWTQMLDAYDELWKPGAGVVKVTLDAPPSTTSVAATRACPDVDNIGKNQYVATKLSATGVTCSQAAGLVLAVVAAEGDPGGKTHVTTNGFSCSIRQTPVEASLLERYACSAGARRLTWSITFGE